MPSPFDPSDRNHYLMQRNARNLLVTPATGGAPVPPAPAAAPTVPPPAAQGQPPIRPLPASNLERTGAVTARANHPSALPAAPPVADWRPGAMPGAGTPEMGRVASQIQTHATPAPVTAPPAAITTGGQPAGTPAPVQSPAAKPVNPAEKQMGALSREYRATGPGIGPNRPPEPLPRMQGAPRMNQPVGLGPNGVGQLPPGQLQLPPPPGLPEAVNPLRVRGGNPAGPAGPAPAVQSAQAPPTVPPRYATESVRPGGPLAVPAPATGTDIVPVARPYTNARQLGPNEPPSVSSANAREVVGEVPGRGPRYPTFAAKQASGGSYGPSAPFHEAKPANPLLDYMNTLTPEPRPDPKAAARSMAEYAGTYKAPAPPVTPPAPKNPLLDYMNTLTPDRPSDPKAAARSMAEYAGTAKAPPTPPTPPTPPKYDFYSGPEPKAGEAGKAFAGYANEPYAAKAAQQAAGEQSRAAAQAAAEKASGASATRSYAYSPYTKPGGGAAEAFAQHADDGLHARAQSLAAIDDAVGLGGRGLGGSAGIGGGLLRGAMGLGKAYMGVDVVNEMLNQFRGLTQPSDGSKGIFHGYHGPLGQTNENDQAVNDMLRHEAGAKRERIPTLTGLVHGSTEGGKVNDPNYKPPTKPLYFNNDTVEGRLAFGSGATRPGESIQDARKRIATTPPDQNSTLVNLLTKNFATAADQMGLGDVNRYFGGQSYNDRAQAPTVPGPGGTPTVPGPGATPAFGGEVAGTQATLPTSLDSSAQGEASGGPADQMKYLQSLPDKAGPLPPSGQRPLSDFLPPTVPPGARIAAPGGIPTASRFPTQPAPATILPGAQAIHNDPLDSYRMGLIDQINDLGSAPFQRQAALSSLHALGGGHGNSAEVGQGSYHADPHFDPLAADKSSLMASQAVAAEAEAAKNLAQGAHYDGSANTTDRKNVLDDEHDLYLHILGTGQPAEVAKAEAKRISAERRDVGWKKRQT